MVGGTSQALRIAKDYDIPVYNLFNHTPENCVEFLTKIGIVL
jgi:hypothetical protein